MKVEENSKDKNDICKTQNCYIQFGNIFFRNPELFDREKLTTLRDSAVAPWRGLVFAVALEYMQSV